ncbi:amidase [Bradyrhizobium sp.]|uniref:amidase n=1 Tax=Bradyrhizobium sp. TaxID=376 RepID=UPI0027361636|nr:amidase [Bradyrhizobium sp.]MDP3690571.1 amidase [Bradyrhizobium sp.]
MTTPKLHELGAAQAAVLLARRELKAEDLVRACLERAAARNEDIHAFVHIDAVSALAHARALDAGAVRGPLHGLPIGVKDLFDTADLPTGYGSSLYAHHRPAADAASVALCREAGAVLLGKTVTTEFAYFTPGPTVNPHNPLHTPGGSSSGSAAAVAEHMVPLALGTQTAGSIIRPAAYCGVVGYKPSLGRVMSAGVKSLSPTMDVIGGFGRSVRDAALLGAVLTGDMRLLAGHEHGTLRIGLFPSPSWPLAELDTQRAWEIATAALSRNSDSCQDVVLPQDFAELIQLQKDLMTFEMARSLSHERLRHREALSPQLVALLDAGMAIDGATHEAYLQRTADWRLRIDSLFERHDVLLTPSTTGVAPAGLAATGDPLFCRSWSLLGLPAVHLPFATGAKGLPVGLQLVGRMGEDHKLLAAAQRIHERLLY